MRTIIVLLLLLVLAGCMTSSKKTYYENGNLKSDEKYEGMSPWSNGDGKVLNMPLSHTSLNGVGI